MIIRFYISVQCRSRYQRNIAQQQQPQQNFVRWNFCQVSKLYVTLSPVEAPSDFRVFYKNRNKDIFSSLKAFECRGVGFRVDLAKFQMDGDQNQTSR